MRACAICARPCVGVRCAEHALRGSWRSPLYQRNARLVRASGTVCWRCGGVFSAGDPVTAGHVVPLAEGGTDELGNLAAEHESCNKRAGRLMQEMGPVWRPSVSAPAGPRRFLA